MFYHVPEFVGFQTMVILITYGMTFDAVGVFGLAFHLLFRSWSTYCVLKAAFLCFHFQTLFKKIPLRLY